MNTMFSNNYGAAIEFKHKN